MFSRFLTLACLLGAAAGAARAEVIDAGEGGFTVEHRVVVTADRATAWQAAVGEVSAWWNGDHTVSGDAANLFIDPRPMGCFCERLGDDSGLVHLVVTFVNPGVLLRMTGGLGPLGLLGANGNLTLEFADASAADGAPPNAEVTLRYAVGGYRDGGMAPLAGPVDAVLGEQLERLAAYIASR